MCNICWHCTLSVVEDKLAPWQQRTGLRRSQSAREYDSISRSWRNSSDINANERRQTSNYRHKMESSSSTVETNNNITDSQKLDRKWATNSGDTSKTQNEQSTATISLQGSSEEKSSPTTNTPTSPTSDASLHNGYDESMSELPSSQQPNVTSLVSIATTI